MDTRNHGARRQTKICVNDLAKTLTACVLLFYAGTVAAQTPTYLQSSPVIVHNDRGGLLRAQLLRLGELRQSHRPVEITGALCYSSCTMYLGLPQTCISSDTVFGFHGPSSYGRALSQPAFERASQLISNYYPPALRAWYLSTGRYRVSGLYKISGKQIVDMGIREC